MIQSNIFLLGKEKYLLKNNRQHIKECLADLLNQEYNKLEESKENNYKNNKERFKIAFSS